jgi:hypothetical protein
MSTENTEATEPEVQQVEPLSLRDALEVAIIAHKDEPTDDTKAVDTDDRAGDEVPTDTQGAAPSEAVSPPPLQAPAEWNKEEKEDFAQLSRKSQEAALRVHNGRGAKLEEIKREAAELQWAKDLVKQAETFYRAKGETVPSAKDFINAFQVVNNLRGAESPKTIAAVLQAQGLPIPPELQAAVNAESEGDKKTPVHPEVEALKQEVARLSQKSAQEEQAKTVSVLTHTWQEFEQTRNPAGGPKYADIVGNDESALKLQSLMGSLVAGNHTDSVGFAAYVKARIPETERTHSRVYEEAYKWFGGKVDESPAPKTQTTQAQITKSSRAAASVPGRGTSGPSGGQIKKFASTREALASVLAERNDD